MYKQISDVFIVVCLFYFLFISIEFVFRYEGIYTSIYVSICNMSISLISIANSMGNNDEPYEL